MPTYEDLLKLPAPLDEGRVLLFDGHSFAYRSYYAIRELTTRSGEPVNALFGFWLILLRMLREYPSAHTAVVFDASGKNFRHELYADYKATRKPMPEDLRPQIPRIKELLAALGIPVLCEPGVEADDVLASLATQAAGAGLNCLIATSDKDMAQVVDERISLLRPSGRRGDAVAQRLDPNGVEEKYGVPPDRIVDLLSLIGDTSDNVPGVPGVGEKTAAKLLKEYGTLDAVLEHAEEVRNKRVRVNLLAHGKAAHLARQLIELKRDLVPGDVRETCRMTGADEETLAAFLTQVEFSGALKDLGLSSARSDKAPKESTASSPEPVETGPKTRNQEPGRYETILDKAGLDALVRAIEASDAFALDLETTSLDPMKARIVGIALSLEPYVGYYIPVGHQSLDAPEQLPLDTVLEALRPSIEGKTPKLHGQNLKYDVSVLAQAGVVARGLAFDTMIASHLVRPEERRHGLDAIASHTLGYTMLTYEEVAGKDGDFAAVPIDVATRYAAEDAEIVERLIPHLQPKLEAGGVADLFRDVELPLIPVLGRMERHGILVDANTLAQQGEDLRRELRLIEADLEEIAGGPFNPNSPKQVAEVLFERIGLPVVERTKTGPSTSARVLAELAVLHPLPGKLMAHRELRKLLTTYIDQLPKAINPKTGRIHTSFHQTATATGRLSSSDPNLQNIPTRTETGGRIRHAFIAPSGTRLIGADYSQIELRLLAHFSEDETLIEAFRTGADLHRLTASHVFGVSEGRVTDRQRDEAKRVNFGILYGISPYGLSRELGITHGEAKAYIERFFGAYPRAKAYLDEMVETATEKGYAETILGRRRPLPNLGSRNVQRRSFDRRNAVNTPIQGSAADLIKLAMIRIDEWIEAERPPVKMLLQVHDELIFEVAEDAVDETLAAIRGMMESVMSLRLPLSVKTAVGEHWGEL